MSSTLIGAMIGISIVGTMALASAHATTQRMQAQRIKRSADSAATLEGKLKDELAALAEDAFTRESCDAWEPWIRDRAAGIEALGVRPFSFTKTAPNIRIAAKDAAAVAAACAAPRFPDGAGSLRFCLALSGAGGQRMRSFLGGRPTVVVVSARASDPRTGEPAGCGPLSSSLVVKLDAVLFFDTEIANGALVSGRRAFQHTTVVAP